MLQITPQFGVQAYPTPYTKQAKSIRFAARQPMPAGGGGQNAGGPQQPRKGWLRWLLPAAILALFLPSPFGNSDPETCTPPAAVASANPGSDPDASSEAGEAGKTEAPKPTVDVEKYEDNQEIASTDDALELINGGGVCKASLVNIAETPTPFFELTLTNNKTVKFTLPVDQEDREDVAKALGDQGIFIDHPDPSQPSVLGNLLMMMLPLMLIVGLLIFMQRRMMGGGAAGMLNSKKFDAVERPSTRFNDVRGYPEIIEELDEIKHQFQAQRSKSMPGSAIPSKPIKGVLLTGPPGTGKTLMARAFAGECGLPFIKISGSDFVEMFVGVGAKRVRDLFANARKLAGEQGGCVIFIDEIDAIGRQRGSGMGNTNDEREGTLNQILIEMDGFDQNSNILVMAATNQPGVLDNGLTRSGRFDRKVEINAPDGPEMRLEILDLYAQQYIKNNQLAEDVKLEKIAKITDGFVGADLALLFNEAAITANRSGREKITMEHFKEAILRMAVGPKKKHAHASEAERKTVNGHEFGHAVAAMAAQWNLFVVSTTPRGNTLGLVMPSRDGSRLTYRNEALQNMLMTASGRSAERVFFGPDRVTAGAAGDLQQMENLFRRMMSVGLLNDRVVSKYANPHIPLEQRDETTKDNVFNAAFDAGARLMSLIPPERHGEILSRLVSQQEDLLNEDAEAFIRDLLGPDFDWQAAYDIVAQFVGQDFVDAPPQPAAS